MPKPEEPEDLTAYALLSEPSPAPDVSFAVLSVRHLVLDQDEYEGDLWLVPLDGREPPLAGIKPMVPDARRLPMKYRFRYTGIRVRDLDRSLAFYRDVLGMKEIGRGEMPHGGVYVHLRTPGGRQRLELNWYPEGSRFHTPYRNGEEMDHLAFVVDDVRKAYAELKAKGVEVAVAPREAKGVTEVYVKDPDGIWIELLQ